jgi:ABC-type dipeptide/oligopeptide/nickel transport system permease component
VFIKLLPLPPVSTFGQDANIILQRRELLGYGKPIISQFFIFLERVLVYGDWGVGETLRTGSNVWDVFIEKLPATMVVNLYSIIVSIPIGLALGIYAALKKNKWQDHLISTLVMIFISVPSFVYAFLVQYIFCYRLGWFPFQMDTTGSYLSASTFVSLIPAIMSLAFGSIAGFTRYTRAELSEVLTSDFMLLARTKGLTRGQATMRHALRNSMVVIFPMILGEFVDILSGSLVIEGMFSIPGVGSLYISAINALDYNFFMLLSVFYTFVGLLAGLIVDISYGIIDPRIKMGAK